MKGSVVDAVDMPLPYAMVIVLDTSLQRTLTYGNTDTKGRFSLPVDSVQPIILVCRYLGKRADSLLVAPPWTGDFTIRLADGAALPEIEITTDRPPITERGDTTTYHLADFQDSTDHKIEDVLRKLPGVEVDENGSIEVNGKAIQTILVEGTNLFGMDYQLASKNIRAADIGIVETIDHYQEDAVMRTVNFSEEVVLNLKLRPDKRAIISGEMIMAAGAGSRGPRYQLHTPLYRISRRNKTFTILNADNIAADNGLGSDAGIQTYDAEALRTPLFVGRKYYEQPEIRTQGLPQAFTDNSHTLAGQIRHEYSKENHAIFVRVNGLQQTTGQTNRQREVFVGDAEPYELRNEKSWDKHLGDMNLGLEYRFIAPNQRTSVRIYGKSGASNTDVDQQFRGGFDLMDTTAINEDTRLLRLIVTRKLSERSVIRLEAADQYDQQLTVSNFTDSDLRPLFIANEQVELRQSLTTSDRQTVVTARWLKRFSPRVKIDVSTAFSREQLAFTNLLNDRLVTDSLVLRDLTPAIQAIYAKGKWLHRLKGMYRFNQRGLDRYQANWVARKQLANSRELEINAAQTAGLANPLALLTNAEFAAGAFSATRTAGINTVNQRTVLGTTLRWENNLNLARTTLSLNANRTVNDLISNFIFAGSAVVRRPIVAPAQYGVEFRFNRSFFSLPLKSDVRFGTSVNYRAGVYQSSERLTDFSTLTYAASTRTSWRLSKRLLCKGKLSLQYVEGLRGITLDLFTGRLNTELITSFGKLRAYIAAFTVVNYSPNGRSTLWNTYLGGRYFLPLANNKSLSLFLKIYNPLDRMSLDRTSFSGLFEREDAAATTGGFGFVGCSFGL